MRPNNPKLLLDVVLALILLVPLAGAAPAIATPNPPLVTNAVIDVGQISTINTVISNGLTSFVGNWLWIPPAPANAPTGFTTMNAIAFPSNVLSLTVQPVSPASLSLVFNGYVFAGFTPSVLGTNNIFGTWTFNGAANDVAPGANVISGLSGTVKINPAMNNPPSITPAAQNNLDVGSAIPITAGGVGGGTGTYTYNFLVFNSISKIIVGNYLVTNSPFTSNTFFLTTTPLMLSNSPLLANVAVTDTASTPVSVNSLNSALIKVNPAMTGAVMLPQSAVTPTNVNVGAKISLSASFNGGTPPYTYNFRFFGQGNAMLMAFGSVNALTSNTVIFVPPPNWAGNIITVNAVISDGAQPSGSIPTSNSILLMVFPNTSTYQPSFNTPAPIFQYGTTFTVSLPFLGGSGTFTYNWFRGIVTGGFDQMQFSFIPPFPPPQPPPPNTPPTGMLKYQNPGNTLTVASYIWNGLAFNAVPSNNANAVPGGNETALSGFMPNLFTVTSQIPVGLNIIVPGGPGVLAPKVNPTSQVIYSLDSYSLVQSNTVNGLTVLGNPALTNALNAGYVRTRVLVTNLGLSANFVSAFTPPLTAMIQGYTPFNANGMGFNAIGRGATFIKQNFLPGPGQSSEAQMPFPLFLDNVTGVSIFGPTPPAPGIQLSIYESANAQTPLTDTNNNILLATYTYNGPRLLYPVNGVSYYGDIPANGPNVVQYTGENSIPVNLILTANVAIATSVPTSQVPYFTFNIPEISVVNGAANSFVLANFTNSTFPGQYPTYQLVKFTGMGLLPNIVYQSYAGGNAVSEQHANLTARGSGFGPITPFSFTYYMAENAVTFNTVAFNTANSFTFNSQTTVVGPNEFLVTTNDVGTNTPSNRIFGGVLFPKLGLAKESITNTSLHVGTTTFINITFSGGQPPFTGQWSMFPPGSGNVVTSNTFTLTLPVNSITLLVNVVSANTLTLTPTLGTNSSYGGGRNNTMTLLINTTASGTNMAWLVFPSFGSTPPHPLLMYTGLVNSTLYGLWGANSTVNNTDPGESFTILTLQPATTTISGGGGGSTSVATTTSATTTVTTAVTVTTTAATTAKTTALATTTIPPVVVAVSPAVATVNKTVNVSASRAVVFNFSNANATVVLSSTPPAAGAAAPGAYSVQVSMTNLQASAVALPPPPVANGTRLAVLNISVKSNQSNLNRTLVNVTAAFPCSTNSKGIAPFKLLKNGTWRKITPFTVNPVTCKANFNVPPDPIVALYYSALLLPPATNSTSVASTTSAASTSILPPPNPGPSQTIYYIIAVVVVVVAVAAWYLTKKK